MKECEYVIFKTKWKNSIIKWRISKILNFNLLDKIITKKSKKYQWKIYKSHLFSKL